MKKRTIVYFAAAAFCVLYYIAIGLYGRFGLAQSWVWLFLAAVFCVGGIGSLMHPPKWPARLFRALLALGLAFLLGLMGIVATGMAAKLPPDLDYVIILGARVDPGPTPSKSLRRRLTAAEQYLANEPETRIIASGGKGTDEQISEAQCIFNELTAAGIDPNRIVLEEDSTSTMENFVNSRALIADDNARVGFITNNFHVCRSRLLAKHAGFEHIDACAAPFEGILPLHFVVREALGLVAEFLRGNLG